MAEIKKEDTIEKFKKEGFSFAALRNEVDFNSMKVKEEVKSEAPKIKDKINVSLLKIKTESEFDIAIAKSIKQETDIFETVSLTQNEINGDEDISYNKEVTIHFLIPENIVPEKTGLLEIESEEGPTTSTSSPDVLTEANDQPPSSISCDLIPENSSGENISESSDRQQKRKHSTDFVEEVTPQSSSEDVEPHKSVKKRRKRKTSTEKKSKSKETAVCPFCDKIVNKTYFTRHVRVHTDERPYKCPKCSYSSRFKGTLAHHTKSHHPTQGYIKPSS